MKSFTAIVALALASVAAVNAAPTEKRADVRLYYKIVGRYYNRHPYSFCPAKWDVACTKYATEAGALQAPSPSCTYNANLDGGVIMADCVFESIRGTYTDATPIIGNALVAEGMLTAV